MQLLAPGHPPRGAPESTTSKFRPRSPKRMRTHKHTQHLIMLLGSISWLTLQNFKSHHSQIAKSPKPKTRNSHKSQHLQLLTNRKMLVIANYDTSQTSNPQTTNKHREHRKQQTLAFASSHKLRVAGCSSMGACTRSCCL